VVAIDSHGNSLYDQLQDKAHARLGSILQDLAIDRNASQKASQAR
jgi:hypothetical protein